MTTWVNLTVVAIGGATGSVARYLLTLAAAAIPGGSTHLGTTACNFIGCAAIGAFYQFSQTAENLSDSTQLAIRVGLLGGLTTFSSLALESFLMVESGRWGLSVLCVLANLILGGAALVIAMSIVRSWTS